MPASLPPSSRVSRARFPADASMMARPVAVEPVNITLSTCGWAASSAPTSPFAVIT